MITRTTRACLVAASLCVLSGAAMAVELPHHGASMDDVRQKFGAPVTDLGAVGKPAITRWVYDQFTVYFEGHRVIQAVQTQPLGSAGIAPQAAPQPVQPAPAARPAPVSPPPAFTPTPAPAPAAISEPVAETPVAEPVAAPAAAVQPVVEPAAAAPAVAAPVAAPAASSGSSGGFRFDPATGRLVIDSDQPKEEEPAEPTPAPAVSEPAASVPAAAPANAEESSAPVGAPRTDAPDAAPMEETLEFDPETGTFKPKSG